MEKSGNNLITISTGTIIRFLAIILFAYLIFFLRDIVLVILMAIVVASAIEPGTRWFIKRRLPRVPSVLLIYIGTILIVVGSFYFLFLPILNESSQLLRTLPEYTTIIDKTAALQDSGVPQGLFAEVTDTFSLSSIIDFVNQFLSNISAGFFGAVDVIFGSIISFLLIIALSFYLAVQEDGVTKFLRIVLPQKQEEYVVDLWKRSRTKIGLWMQGQLILAVIVGVLVYLGLSILQIKHALLLAVLAAVFEIIPIFGAFLAAAPAILIAFLNGGLAIALIVAGLYLVIQQFESQLIYPLVVKKIIGVPPIISILALVIGAKIAGFLGIILSVPLATVLMELLNDLERRKALAKEN